MKKLLDNFRPLGCSYFIEFYVFLLPSLLNKLSDHLKVPHLYCIGDANGKMMLAHAASAQGISGIKPSDSCSRVY